MKQNDIRCIYVCALLIKNGNIYPHVWVCIVICVTYLIHSLDSSGCILISLDIELRDGMV